MNIGTIGTGSIVEKFITNIQKTEHLHCTAVYSRNEARGKAMAGRFGIAAVYTDMEAFLNDEDIDVVYVASPNSLHYEQSREALKHHKHVICEKPMTPYLAQAEELYLLAQAKGRMLLEAVTIAHAPNFEVIKNRLGEVGWPRLVLCSYSQYSSRYDLLRDGEVTNVFDPRFSGGALMDINFYNIYETVALFGRPRSVAYYPNKFENGIDTSGIAVLVYPDFVCQCTGAKDTWGVNSVQIQGEDGYIFVEGSTNANGGVRIVTRDGEEFIDRQPDGDQWYYELQSLDAILENEDMDACDRLKQATLDTAWVLEQARKSAGMSF